MFFLAKTVSAKTFTEIANNPTVNSLFGKISYNIIIPLVQGLFLVAVLFFILGVFRMISNGDDPTARKEGQKNILWGVVGMAIMVSVYGIVRLIGNTVGVDPFK